MSDVLEITMRIDAEAETVFPFFTEPEKYVQWKGSSAVLDPRPGGEYRVRMREGIETSGQFLEIDPPKRVVFTWGWEGDAEVPPGSTRVEVSLEPDGAATLVRIRHHDLPTAEQIARHRQGWEMYANRLAVRATGGDPGPDPNAPTYPGAL